MSSEQLRALANANYAVNKSFFATKQELQDVKASSVPFTSLQAMLADLQEQVDTLKTQVEVLTSARMISAARTSIHRR